MLQSGTIEALFSRNTDSPLFNLPVVQILALKKIERKTDQTFRFHGSISDGKFHMKGIFSSQVSKECQDLSTHSIIRICDFVITEKNGTCFIYVKKCQKIADHERIGTPKNISNEKDSFHDQESSNSKIEKGYNTQNQGHPNDQTKMHFNPKENTPNSLNSMENRVKRPQINNPTSNHEFHDENKTFTPIAALNPFQNKWFIKGTVQKKSDMRDFKNKTGKLFTFEIFDRTGSIKIISFNEAAHLFFDLVKDETVIEISRATVKMTNKQFNTCSSDYEIHLDKNSYYDTLDEKPIDVKYDFCKINEISSRTEKGKCTVVGIVHEVYSISTVIAKQSQKELQKRDIILVDETGSIKLTLWGDQTTLYLEDNPVLLVSDARIAEFNNQITLSSSFQTILKVDPEINESFSIKGWYDANKSNITIQRSIKNVDYSFLEEVQTYSTCIATLLFIREDNLFYNACADNCNKKVTFTDEGYHCERCNQTKDTCNIRYLTTFHASDFTQQIWLQVFDEFCTYFFGMPAEELKRMGEENSHQLQSFLKSLLFKEYVIKLHKKEQIYQGEMKVRWRGLSIQKVDYNEECVRMMKLMNIS